MNDENSWLAWSKHVLLELERQSKCLTEIKTELGNLKGDIKVLKFKSGVWGAIAGAIPILIVLGIWLIKNQ